MKTDSYDAVRFEVDINGSKSVVAGVPHGVLNALITWVARDPNRWDGRGTLEEWVSGEVNLSLGGIDGRTDEFVTWLTQSLNEGDEVTIEVLGPGDYDEPARRFAWTEQALRLRHLKDLIERLNLLIRHRPDHVVDVDTSHFVSFDNILNAFAEELPQLVSEIKPTGALTAGDLLGRAEKLLGAIDVDKYED